MLFYLQMFFFSFDNYVNLRFFHLSLSLGNRVATSLTKRVNDFGFRLLFLFSCVCLFFPLMLKT